MSEITDRISGHEPEIFDAIRKILASGETAEIKPTRNGAIAVVRVREKQVYTTNQ